MYQGIDRFILVEKQLFRFENEEEKTKKRNDRLKKDVFIHFLKTVIFKNDRFRKQPFFNDH